MNKRVPFVDGQIYHVFNKSIAGFRIFVEPANAIRFIKALFYYNSLHISKSLSVFLRDKADNYIIDLFKIKNTAIVKFLAYCIMPDHYHILLKMLKNDTFPKYINDIENSYTRYFNIKHNRKGPLWQSPFKSVLIKTDSQLLHVTRYIHLNPTTDGLVEKPEDWSLSSYKNYLKDSFILDNLKEISVRNPYFYKKFVEDRKDYQKRLKKIKKLLLE